MKLPFTWAELSPEDKAWLENVPATAVWDFVAKLPKLERLPFDDPYHAPSGADFMRKYGDRLRVYVREHENDPLEIDPELDAALSAGEDSVDEYFRKHIEAVDADYKRYAPNGRIEKPEDTLIADYRRMIEQLLVAARNYRTHHQADQKKITKLTAERDAARKAYLDMIEKGEGCK